MGIHCVFRRLSHGKKVIVMEDYKRKKRKIVTKKDRREAGLQNIVLLMCIIVCITCALFDNKQWIDMLIFLALPFFVIITVILAVSIFMDRK